MKPKEQKIKNKQTKNPKQNKTNEQKGNRGVDTKNKLTVVRGEGDRGLDEKR